VRISTFCKIVTQARNALHSQWPADWNIDLVRTLRYNGETPDGVMGCCVFDERKIYLAHQTIHGCTKRLPRQIGQLYVIKVLAHELAHIHAGMDAGHGKKWKLAFRRLLKTHLNDTEQVNAVLVLAFTHHRPWYRNRHLLKKRGMVTAILRQFGVAA